MGEDLTGLEGKGLRRAQKCEAKHSFLLEGDCRRVGVSEVDERGQATPPNNKGWERKEAAGIEVADWIRGKAQDGMGCPKRSFLAGKTPGL